MTWCVWRAQRERITISNIWRTPPKRERRHEPEWRATGTAIVVVVVVLAIAALGILKLFTG